MNAKSVYARAAAVAAVVAIVALTCIGAPGAAAGVFVGESIHTGASLEGIFQSADESPFTFAQVQVFTRSGAPSIEAGLYGEDPATTQTDAWEAITTAVGLSSGALLYDSCLTTPRFTQLRILVDDPAEHWYRYELVAGNGTVVCPWETLRLAA